MKVRDQDIEWDEREHKGSMPPLSRMEEVMGLGPKTPRRRFLQRLGQVLVTAGAGLTVGILFKKRMDRFEVIGGDPVDDGGVSDANDPNTRGDVVK